MVPTPERTATNDQGRRRRPHPELDLAAPRRGDPRLPADRRGRTGCTTPLLVIGVEGDATTPTDHAEALYEAAQGPKRLIMQRHTTHYAAYDRYWEQVTPAHRRVVRRATCAPRDVGRDAPTATARRGETIEHHGGTA